MKHLSIVISFSLIFAANAISQVNAYNPFYVPRSLPDKDSLKAIVQNSKDPIQKLIALRELGHTYYENKRDSALYYFEQSITAARNIKSRLWEADACNSIGFVSYVQGNYPRGLQFLTQAVSLAEDPASENGEWKPQVSGFVSPRTARLSILARSYQHLAVLYGYTGNYSEYSDKELYYFGKALEISTSLGDKAMMGIINMNTARHYSFGPHLDSTIFYKERAMELMNEAGYSRYIGTLMFNLGEAYRRHQQPEMAKQCYWYGMEAGKSIENTRSVADNALALANIYQAQLNTDSAVYYGRVAANRYKSTLILSGLADSYAILSSAFNTKNSIDSAFHYQGLSLATRKELDADDKVRRFQQISFDEQIKAQEAAEKDRQVRNRIITSFLLAGLAILALIGVFLYRNNLARKKANQLLEEKNKELEIESALEKVRTRSLAMHKSEELQEVTNTVFEQMRALKIEAQTITIFITIEGSKDYNCWLQNDEQNYFSAIKFPYIKGNTVSEDHQMGSGDIESKTYERDLKDDWFHFMFTKSEMRNIPESRKRYVLDAAYFTASVAEMKYTKIGLYRYTDKAFTNQEYRILKRFAQVFEQAYIRFLDLEKAEGQAREALIEAALERTRTQSMLMQHSDEIRNISEVFHQQLLHLNIPSEFSYVWLPNEEKKDHQFWASWEEHEEGEKVYKSKQVTYPLDKTEPYTAACFAAWASPDPTHVEFIPPADVPTFFEAWKELLEGARNLTASHFPDGIYYAEAYMKYGCFGINIRRELTGDEKEVLRRFSIEFERAYTRFLDLQKAEANAREAQIEAALERVRSRTMAMHKSDELKDVIHVVYEQFVHLNMHVEHAGFIIDYKNRDDMHIWLADPNRVPSEIFIPYFDSPHWNSFIEAKATGKDLFTNLLNFEEKNKFYQGLFNFFPIPDETRNFYLTCPGLAISTVLIDNVGLYIENFSGKPYTEEENTVLMRFGKVFQQTYTRFLDLQKAEAQAREAQIGMAMERIRARALAMHSSSELLEVANVLREQMGLLNQPDLETSAVLIFHNDLESWDSWYAFRPTKDITGKIRTGTATFYKDSCAFTREIAEHFISPENAYTLETSGEKREEWIKVLMKAAPEIAENAVNDEIENFDTTYFHFSDFKGGSLLTVSYLPPSDEIKSLQQRAANVFDLAYRRFLDLKKAEAQAREAQIETALERIRSRSMAMHKSEELSDLSLELVKQVQALGVATWFCAFNIYDDDANSSLEWGSNGQGVFPKYRTPREGIFLRYYEAGQRGETLLINEIGEEECPAHYDYLCTLPGVGDQLLEMKAAGIPFPTHQIDHVVFFKYGYLLFITYEPVPETHDIFKRFARVFEQSYTRFLDLKTAEAQAREAQIEAALERVRSRSLAMHHTDELQDVVNVAAQQLLKMNIDIDGGMFIAINDEVKDDLPFWAAAGAADYVQKVTLPYFDRPTFTGLRDAILRRDSFYTEHYSKEEKDEFMRFMFNHHPWNQNSEEKKRELLAREGGYARSLVVNRYTSIGMTNHHGKIFSDADNAVLKRFGAVVEQSYTRFLDLQKAETQAREAQIEAALERVRSKTMAMSNSDDVGETVATLFAEFSQLGIHTNRCGILIFDNEDYAEVWTARSNADGKASLIIGMLDLNAHQMLRSIYNAWRDGRSSHRYDLKAGDLISYYDAINRTDLYPVKFDLNNLPAEEFHSDFYFPEGTVFAFSPNPIEDEHARIMKRFAGVFGQTYRRYLDLQKAEAGAKEAIKQAALDRIRAEIASMRTKQDLDRITPLIWTELKILNIPFLRCGIFIMDDAVQQIHTFLSAPDGRAIASFNLAYDNSANISAVVGHWQQNKTYVEHWNLAEFNSLADSLVQQGYIKTREQYTQTLPADGLFLHFVPFMQGMLYAGNKTALGADEISLLQAVADAFSTAYARYEDFNKVEKTLYDLRQTQKQLVQAEKMASLGELTAGIAHEIQNPLNFVNNFSEINVELVDEINEAADKGDIEEIKALAADIRSNQEKIREHGRRADGIVKGMLQHSRTGGGSTEPTDLNVLAEEYLRLAFHGLRAKDKSFQSDYTFHPDPSLGKVNIVPQDIGRVLLNLINNAFYVVQEKAATGIKDYKPRVEVSTERKGKTVVLTVKDNGNGIPENIKDKIFQPFFTTKPTGQGTGLGLSLSYDIVKAHGGELKVGATGKTGTTFEIMLPG